MHPSRWMTNIAQHFRDCHCHSDIAKRFKFCPSSPCPPFAEPLKGSYLSGSEEEKGCVSADNTGGHQVCLMLLGLSWLGRGWLTFQVALSSAEPQPDSLLQEGLGVKVSFYLHRNTLKLFEYNIFALMNNIFIWIQPNFSTIGCNWKKKMDQLQCWRCWCPALKAAQGTLLP